MNVEIKEQMYEGKAKQVFATSDPEIVMVHYKDDATAGDGEKKGTIRDKGIVNNKLSNALMQKLEKEGIPTHYVEELNDRDTLVKKVQIVPLEVIIRNVAAGHFSLRMGAPAGTALTPPLPPQASDKVPFVRHDNHLTLETDLEGSELFEVSLGEFSPTRPADETADTTVGTAGTSIAGMLCEGRFALYLAGEPYKSGLKAQGCGKLKKAVFTMELDPDEEDETEAE